MGIPRLIRTPFRRHPPDTGAAFERWLQTPLGARLLAAEKAVLADVLPRLPGVRALQCAVGAPQPLLDESVAPLHWSLGRQGDVDVRARPAHLPLQRNSLDLVLLHHSLDFEDDPHLVLGEAARVLQPGGALVVVGFQPLSLWGLTRLLRLTSGRVPWMARFIRPHRVSDWLHVLACEVEGFESSLHGWPRVPRRPARASWLERLGGRFWSQHGAFYVLVARKRAAMVRPLRPRFALPQAAPNVIPVSMARWQQRTSTEQD
ncbi:MAG: SAM-dependent methyltransferase [Alcanivorax sp.]|nr:SAM-dependent methyltransferase [Alcanivorax sp.]